MYNIEIYKNDAYELICKAEIETERENNFMDTYGYKRWEEENGMNWETAVDTYSLLCVKQVTNENLLYSTKLYSELHGDLKGKDILKRGIRVYIELIHLAVHQELIQHC